MLGVSFKTICNPSLWCVLLLAISCGVEVGNPKNPTNDGTTETKNQIISDNDAAAEMLTAQIDTVVSGTTEHFAEDATTLALNATTENIPDSLSLADPTITLTCDATSTRDLIFKRKADGALEKEVGRGLLTRVHKATVADEVTATWKSDSDNLACVDAKRPRVDIASLTKINITHAVKKARSREVMRKRDSKVLKTGSFDLSGDRTIVLEKIDAGFKETISANETRNIALKSAQLGDVKLETQVKIDSESPMVIKTAGPKLGQWTEKTIESGVITSEEKSGAYIETTFSNVKFTQEDGCVPSSGSITSKLFDKKDTSEPRRTLTVVYGAEDVQVKFDSGETVTLVLEGCGE